MAKTEKPPMAMIPKPGTETEETETQAVISVSITGEGGVRVDCSDKFNVFELLGLLSIAQSVILARATTE